MSIDELLSRCTGKNPHAEAFSEPMGRETAYLLRSPANAKRLMDSIEELRAGKGLVKGLED